MGPRRPQDLQATGRLYAEGIEGRRIALVLGFSLGILLGMSSAVAQAPLPGTNDNQNQILFLLPWCQTNYCREAEQRQLLEDWDGALDRLDHIASDPMDPSAALAYFGIAVINAKLERPQDGLNALIRYREFIRASDEKNLPPGQRGEQVEQVQTVLLSLIGHVELQGGPVGAEVVLDDRSLGQLPLAATPSVNPGPHMLVVTASDGTQNKLQLQIGAGQTRTVHVDKEMSWPAHQHKETTSPSKRRIAGSVLTATGAAGTVMGIVLLSLNHLCTNTLKPPDIVTIDGMDQLSCYPGGSGGYYKNEIIGPILLTSGVAALTAGVFLTITPIDKKANKKQALTLSPLIKGASTGIGILF